MSTQLSCTCSFSWFILFIACVVFITCKCIQNALSSEEADGEQADEVSTSTKRRVTEEDQEAEDHKKSRVEEGQDEQKAEQREEDQLGFFKADGVEFELNFSRQKPKVTDDTEDTEEEQYFIGTLMTLTSCTVFSTVAIAQLWISPYLM